MGGCAGILRRLSGGGQHGQFAACGAAQVGCFQIALRVGKYSRYLRGCSRIHNGNGLACCVGLAPFCGMAGFAPDVGFFQQTLGVELGGCLVAGAAAAVAAEPGFVQHQDGFFARNAQRLRRHDGVAAHAVVVTHAKCRVKAGKGLPVARLPQLQQPIVAQAVFLIRAGVAAQKSIDFCLAGSGQAGGQFPIGRPRLQRVAAGLRQPFG